jgi:hypothetical protein
MKTEYAAEAAIELAGLPLFERMGQPISGDFASVDSLDRALESNAQLEWENTRLEAANTFGFELQAVSKAEYQLWNDVILFANDRYRELIEPKLQAILLARGLPEKFRSTTRWNAKHVMLEAAYRDVVRPRFSTWLMDVYRQGHFPCGWRGNWPEGRLLVY